jgi:hypothetical protein
LTGINPEGLKALRQLALDRDATVQAVMIEAAIHCGNTSAGRCVGGPA